MREEVGEGEKTLRRSLQLEVSTRDEFLKGPAWTHAANDMDHTPSHRRPWSAKVEALTQKELQAGGVTEVLLQSGVGADRVVQQLKDLLQLRRDKDEQ